MGTPDAMSFRFEAMVVRGEAPAALRLALTPLRLIAPVAPPRFTCSRQDGITLGLSHGG